MRAAMIFSWRYPRIVSLPLKGANRAPAVCKTEALMSPGLLVS